MRIPFHPLMLMNKGIQRGGRDMNSKLNGKKLISLTYYYLLIKKSSFSSRKYEHRVISSTENGKFS